MTTLLAQRFDETNGRWAMTEKATGRIIAWSAEPFPGVEGHPLSPVASLYLAGWPLLEIEAATGVSIGAMAHYLDREVGRRSRSEAQNVRWGR